MMNVVRLLSTKIKNFKNVGYGSIDFPNLSIANNHALIKKGDITGIYGPNGSGKTSMVEALDLLQHLMQGRSVPYNLFSGMLMEDKAEIIVDFFVTIDNKKYFVTYGVAFSADDINKIIRIESESFSFKERGYRWKKACSAEIRNGMYQEMEDLFSESEAILYISKDQRLEDAEILDVKKTRKLASYCAMRGLSMLFCNAASGRYELETETFAGTFYRILSCLRRYAFNDLIIVRVSQLGEVNSGMLLPVNMHLTNEAGVVTGCLPLFQQGEGELPKRFLGHLKKSIEAINQVLHAIVPNLSIRIDEVNTYENEEGDEMVRVKTYSERDGRKFLTRYESEGIKRIISLLHAIVFAYNYQNACLIVDELDAGIFEYLLGDLVGVLFQNAKGQVIFTSHNLRVLETIPCRNAVFTTTNKDNRYIHLRISGNNNNVRDSYLRALSIGGQEEELYSGMDLDPLAFALHDAWEVVNGEK